MTAPDARLRVGAADVRLLGTIAGFVPDADRVRMAWTEHRPDALALGVPAEDLAFLETLRTGPLPEEMPEPDELMGRFLELLARFGATMVPPPDLRAAHDAAKEAGIPVAAVDLDDATYTTRYTEMVKLRHVVQSNVRHRKVLKEAFDAPDAYALALRWDAALATVRPIAELEAQRAAAMADGIRALAKGHSRVLAVVPAARFGQVNGFLAGG